MFNFYRTAPGWLPLLGPDEEKCLAFESLSNAAAAITEIPPLDILASGSSPNVAYQEAVQHLLGPGVHLVPQAW